MAAYTGLIGGLFGALMMVPFVCCLLWNEDRSLAAAFALPAALLIFAGLLVWHRVMPGRHPALKIEQGGVIVVSSWVLCSLAAMWPFFAGRDLPFTLAVFEAVSGLTTTGLSVLDVTATPSTLLLWRSLMQLAGGAGLTIIMLAAIAGPSGTGLSGAEGRGEQLVPHVRKSATLVLALYSAYAAAGTLAYRLAGMNGFDAVNHAFAAVSTGGFSTRPGSIGYWNSPAVEAVSLVLMFLGNFNFVTAYLLFTGRFREVFRNAELRFFASSLFFAACLLFVSTTEGLYAGLFKALRVALFETVTALTTTGFTTVGYDAWPGLGFHVLVILMLIGGGTGSTAGGIKQFRVLLLAKAAGWEVQRTLLPRTAVVERGVWMGQRMEFVTDATLRKLGAFIFFYFTSSAAGTGILAACGYPLQDSAFEFASAIGTVGLSVGITGPHAPAVVLWAEIIGMFLGRLEFMIVLATALKAFRALRTFLRDTAGAAARKSNR